MEKQSDVTRDILFRLIDATYPSDAAFERVANLPPKTVSNWRRGRSSTYLKMLPTLAELLGVSTTDLVESHPVVHGTAEEKFWDAMHAVGALDEEKKEMLYRTLTAVVKVATEETRK